MTRLMVITLASWGLEQAYSSGEQLNFRAEHRFSCCHRRVSTIAVASRLKSEHAITQIEEGSGTKVSDPFCLRLSGVATYDKRQLVPLKTANRRLSHSFCALYLLLMYFFVDLLQLN